MDKTPIPAKKAASPAAVPDVTRISKPSELGPLHEVRHQVQLIRGALESGKRQVGFFLGAGCPSGIYDKEGKASLKYIPDVAALTTAVHAELEGNAEFKKYWGKLADACKTDSVPTPNVENILTQLRTICALKGTKEVDGMAVDILQKLDDKICQSIAKVVGKPLPEHISCYHRFANWIARADRMSPVEVFTPNYDLLLEQALEQLKVPFFDGFVGAREPFFDLAAIEYDKLPARWTRLWKLHGSINWIKRTDGSVFRCYPVPEGQQLLIYPSHLKYDQSRRMPFLAMVDRVRAFFRETNPVLIACGYSFADDHLNEVLLDGLRGNQSAHCFALMYSPLKDCETARLHAVRVGNLSVLALDGAVVGNRPGSYKPLDPSAIGSEVGFDVAPESTDGDAARPGRCQLGDFHHFGLFLETQFGGKTNDQQAAEAS